MESRNNANQPQRRNTMSKSTKALSKPSALITAIAIAPKLEVIAAQVAGAMQETASLSETLGSLTREAGLLLVKSPDQLDPFIDACRQLCASCGLTEGSFKVYMSNIRGVCRAMIDGYKPKDGQSLRAMYDAAPKGTGRQKAPAVKTGARHAGDKVESDDGEDGGVVASAPAPVTKADARRAAMMVLFGHADDELDAALTWAAAHEVRFVGFVAAQVAFDAKPSKKVEKPVTLRAA
jgi:hypothetical protein